MSIHATAYQMLKSFFYFLIVLLHRILIFLKLRNAPSSSEKLIQDFSEPLFKPPLFLPTFLHLPLDSTVSFTTSSQILTGEQIFKNQSEAWKKASIQACQRLSNHGVTRVVFAHGTFMGSDPLSLMRALKSFVPNLPLPLESAIRRLAYNQWHMRVGDNANFLPTYAQLCGATFQRPEMCDLFVWSSENSHIARLQGAIDLVEKIAQELRKNIFKKILGRILFIGHSHAGQIFALISQLLAEQEKLAAPVLLDFLEFHFPPYFVASIRENLILLKNQPMDFVTLGTPPRYAWHPRPQISVLHIVNHRGAEPKAGRLSGLLTTRDGDYVQQWGVAGSDIIANTARERHLNRKLDNILGVGQSASVWLQTTSTLRRTQTYGFTLLVDFGDSNSLIPNCIPTVFGHAAYTRHANFLPILQMCAEHLYSHSP